MALSKAQQAAQRLKTIDQEYRAKRQAAHDAYNKAFDAAMARHGLQINVLHDFHAFPIHFHEDEALVAARKAFHETMATVESEKHAHVARLPRPNVRFMRVAKAVH